MMFGMLMKVIGFVIFEEVEEVIYLLKDYVVVYVL